MKQCPKCGEFIGDDVKECFNCHYNYSYGRIITPIEKTNERIKAENKLQQEIEIKKSIDQQKQEQIKNNPLYEYKTIILNDNEDGTINESKLNGYLTDFAENGWKLHSIFTNEVGKSLISSSVGFISSGINATINQTILIFERCIKK